MTQNGFLLCVIDFKLHIVDGHNNLIKINL